jgi:septal ring factor EnvC (AmiA/AmiB activator)
VKEWLIDQFTRFNVLTIVVMISFVTAMSKANLNKQLKRQSEEIYKDFEEIKDEIREHHTNIQTLISMINSRK